jgi:thiamine-phosphate pyrophosphorylase
VTRRLDFALYAITEKLYSRGRSLREMVEGCLRGGVSIIQLRDKEATTRDLVQNALELSGLTRAYSVPLLINDRVDVALAASANGVHLGRDDMDPGTAREILGPESIIGKTVRNASEAIEAESEGVDYVAAGSIYRSKTKEAQVIGLEGLRGICDATSLPVVAIGGIGLGNLKELFDSGACGVAAAKELLDFPDIEGRVREFRLEIERLALESAREKK